MKINFRPLAKPRSDRIGPDRTGPDRTGPDRTGPDRIGSDRIGSDRIGSDRTISDRQNPDWFNIKIPANRHMKSLGHLHGCPSGKSSYSRFNKIIANYTSEESLINVDSFVCKGQLNKVQVPDLGRSDQQIIFRPKTK